jgi:hypothetical protein
MSTTTIEGGATMESRVLRNRFWVETALGSTTAILAVVTLISRDWIEVLFGVDPDGGSGALEWTILAALATASLALGLMARKELQHAAG